MNKVFLLLRDNKQLGPFTIDELLQQKLTNNDFIWVEGYSHAWCLPSDLDLLKLSLADSAPFADFKPSAPDSNNANKKSIQNSKAVSSKNKKKRKWADEDLEGRAEEIRRRTFEYVSTQNTSTTPLITDDKSRSFEKTPEIDFVIHKKKRGVSANFIGASLVALMLVGGWYGKDRLFIAQNNSDTTTQDLTPQVIPISSTVQNMPSENEFAPYIKEEFDSVITSVAAVEQSSFISNRSAEPQPAVIASSSEISKKIVEDIKREKQQVKEAEDPILIQPEKKEVAAVISNPESSKSKEEIKASEETEESIEKKKTLGQAIKGIFKKKKKENDTEEENDQ